MKRAMPIEMQQPPSPGRRHAMWSAALASAAALLGSAGGAFATPPATPPATENDMVRDTFNALIAFVVPGSDAYSWAQGESSLTQGGVGGLCNPPV